MQHQPSWMPHPLVPKCDHSVVTHCIVQQYDRHPHLKVLSLIECDLTDEKVINLAEFVHIRGGVAELSLRSNRKLTGRGLRLICQAPVMKKLDLSLCDLMCEDAVAVAAGIARRPWPIEELLLAGNYRMGSMGILALTHQKCCQKIVSLNMSYCDCTDYRVVLILNALTSLEPSATLLQRIKLHGSLVANDSVARALQQLLASASALRSIQLHDPHDPKPMSASQLRTVLNGVQQSYNLEELVIDSLPTTENWEIWKQVDFVLRLNISGRRILRSQGKPPHKYPGFPVDPPDDWFQVLEKAGNESLDVLHWIVRQSSADHFQKCITIKGMQQS